MWKWIIAVYTMGVALVRRFCTRKSTPSTFFPRTQLCDRVGVCVWITNMSRPKKPCAPASLVEYFLANVRDYNDMIIRLTQWIRDEFPEYQHSHIRLRMTQESPGVDVSLLVGSPRGDTYPSGCNVFHVYRFELCTSRSDSMRLESA